jgi:hypothetical protein
MMTTEYHNKYYKDFYEHLNFFKKTLNGILNVHLNAHISLTKNESQKQPVKLDWINEKDIGSHMKRFEIPDDVCKDNSVVFNNLRCNKELTGKGYVKYHEQKINISDFAVLRKILGIDDPKIIPFGFNFAENYVLPDNFMLKVVDVDDTDLIFTMDSYSQPKSKTLEQHLYFQVQYVRFNKYLSFSHPMTHLIIPIKSLPNYDTVYKYTFGINSDIPKTENIEILQSECEFFDKYVIIPFTKSLEIHDLKEYTLNGSRIDRLEMEIFDSEGTQLSIPEETKEECIIINYNFLKCIARMSGFAFA